MAFSQRWRCFREKINRNLFGLRKTCELMMWLAYCGSKKLFLQSPNFRKLQKLFSYFFSEMVLVQCHFLRDGAVSEKKINRYLLGLRKACELMMWFYQNLAYCGSDKNFICNPQAFLSSRSFFHTFFSEMVLVQWHFLRDGAVSEKKIKSLG
jgi:hypothetical protein